MYGSTTACSINVASTSNLPSQQHSAGTIPTTTPTAMYYVSHQLPADAYGKQIIQYGDSNNAIPYGQENIYTSKEVYTSPTNTFNRLPAYSYNLSTGQPEFTSNVQFSTQPLPPSMTNQSNTATPQILPQTYHNQAPIHASPHPVNHQLPNLMFPPPPKGYHQKRGPEPYPPAQVNYQGSAVPVYNNSAAQNVANPQKMQNIQSNNGNSNANGQDPRSSRLSTMFDSTADNYTASWVSSTSSIPADQKIPPDHNSRHNSPTFEFNNWSNELPKMNENAPQQAVQNPALAQPGTYPPQLQQPMQPIYFSQNPQQQQQFQVPTSSASMQPVPYFTPNQQQLLQNMAYPINYYVHPAYVPYPTPFVMPNAMQPYGQNFGQPLIPSIIPQPNQNNIFWPPTAHPLDPQDEKFRDTWLDQNRPTWQEFEVLKDILPAAIEHNYRQMEIMNQPNNHRHHGNNSSASHNNHFSSGGSHQHYHQNGAESGRMSRSSGGGNYNNQRQGHRFHGKSTGGGPRHDNKSGGHRRN